MSPPTREQERALAQAAAGGATAIAAGAGAGKTTLMVEAVWRDVERDGVPLERILVAAYNRAAAAHLAARLQARFADPDDGRGPARPGLDPSAAWIGTFHALAARVVRENPFAAGVDPDFGELEEVEAAALADRALDEAMAECMDRPAFIELVSAARSLEGLRTATRQAYDRLRAAGHERPRIRVPDAPGPGAALLEELEAAVTAVGELAVRDDHLAALEGMREMLLAGEAGAAAPRLAMNCTQALKPFCERANALALRVWQAWVDREARDQLEAFAHHLERFGDRYAALKAARGALDYEDLLLAARRVLRAGNPCDFARVYVDEFQDANRLQADIVDLLAGERTVVVGDGTQAIYGFRHADSEHFVQRAGNPPEVTLRDNHRSQPPLLAALNGLLAAALAEEETFAELVPAAGSRPGPEVAREPVEIVDVRSGDGARATREQEAQAVAAAVAGLLERGYRRRDIAVLFRALTTVEPYRAALEARGIRAHLVAGRGFFSHEQVADTMALLALVENPYDEGALIRVLASPYVGAGDADLLALRETAGDARAPGWPAEGALWAAVPALGATRPLAGMVAGLRPLLRERGLAGLVEAAASANGYDLAVLGMPDGARRYANLRRLVRMADGHAAVRGPDLRGFLSVLRAMAEAGNQDPGEATLVDPALDAVRLTTVHGVKGQEFPAVVVADASHAMPSDAPMVIVDRDGSAAIRVSRVGADPTWALGYREALDRAAAAAAAEERRVIYVAATRAERHLTVVGRSTAAGNVKNGAYAVLGGASGLAEEGVADLGGGRVAFRVVEVPPAEGPDVRGRMVAPPPEPMPLPQVAPAPRPDPVRGRRLSFTALATLATCARRFHLEHELGLRGRPGDVVGGPAPGAAPSAWGGTAFGNLVHRRLAALDWSAPGPPPGWAARDAAAAGLPASGLDAARAERQVAGLLASPLAARARAGRPRAEVPFALDAGGVLLTGAIDLLLDEGGGRAAVVDWKTHDLGGGRTAADVAAVHGLQQAVYALVALGAGFAEVTLAWVALEDLDGSPSRTVTAADEAALEAELLAALAPLAGTERPPAAPVAQPFCSGCPGLAAGCPVAAARPADGGAAGGSSAIPRL